MASRPCLYLSTLMEIFVRNHPPAQALWAILAVRWFCPEETEEKDVCFNFAFLCLERALRDRLARLLEGVASCGACRSSEGAVVKVTRGPRPVRLSSSLVRRQRWWYVRFTVWAVSIAGVLSVLCCITKTSTELLGT